MKDDSLISSTASLASLSKAASPLDFSRAGPSGYRKRSASPARRSSG